VNQGRLVLPDHPETVEELCRLEMVLGEAGNVRIAAPKNLHDDMATVVALVSHHCAWLLPTAEVKPKDVEPTIQERCMAQAASQQQARQIEMEGGEW
jgi:phosphoribosyl-ATP pyrophosphohydrolase